MYLNDDASGRGLKTSQHAWTPSGTRERIRKRHRATQPPRRSNRVSDAGALAPVVFSGHVILQPAKIREIKRKEGPCPPKSAMANSMVMLFLAETACTSRFEEDSLRNPKHGKPRFLRSTSQAIAQISQVEPHEHIQTIRN